MASRDPPARNLLRGDSVYQVHRSTTISEFYNRSLVEAASEAAGEGRTAGAEDGEGRAAGEATDLEEIDRSKLMRRQGGMSFGEAAATKLTEATTSKFEDKKDDDTKSTVSSIEDVYDDQNENKYNKYNKYNSNKHIKSVAERQQKNRQSRDSISDDVRVFFEFLTCKAFRVCTLSAEGQEAAALKYEMPLQSVQDTDDIRGWGAGNMEQESPSNMAKAINFSSKRLDDKNAAIALYDEDRLRQEVHEVEIPEEYADDADVNEACDEFSFLEESGGVPEAILVKRRIVDEISVLENNSVGSLEDPRNTKAWSLSPRRKRRLKALARAAKTPQ